MSKFENGMKVSREVLGDAHVDRSLANANAFDQDFQQHITETVWGSVLDPTTDSSDTAPPCHHWHSCRLGP